MAIADSAGLPVGICTASASPHEITLVEETIDSVFTDDAPERIIGDKAYDSDKHDHKLEQERGIELIAPHKRNRRAHNTQDGRKLRPYKRRWLVERLFAWLQNFRRIVTRWERQDFNFEGFVLAGCLVILLRQF